MSEQKKGVTIAKIVIKIKDRELSLTPEEAKELRDVLTNTLGLKDATVTTIREYVSPYVPYVYPNPSPWRWGGWTITSSPIPVDTNQVTVYCALNT